MAVRLFTTPVCKGQERLLNSPIHGAPAPLYSFSKMRNWLMSCSRSTRVSYIHSFTARSIAEEIPPYTRRDTLSLHGSKARKSPTWCLTTVGALITPPNSTSV